MVSTQDSESCDPSSNLGGTYNFFQVKSEFSFIIRQHFTVLSKAVIAQLGERQTEDLKVPGSIPGRGTFCKQKILYFISKNQKCNLRTILKNVRNLPDWPNCNKIFHCRKYNKS